MFFAYDIGETMRGNEPISALRAADRLVFILLGFGPGTSYPVYGS